MGYLVIVVMFWFLFGIQEAFAASIDDGLPYYAEKGTTVLLDILYKLIRIVGCLLTFAWFGTSRAFLTTIGCYLFAWMLKKTALYFSYYRRRN